MEAIRNEPDVAARSTSSGSLGCSGQRNSRKGSMVRLYPGLHVGWVDVASPTEIGNFRWWGRCGMTALHESRTAKLPRVRCLFILSLRLRRLPDRQSVALSAGDSHGLRADVPIEQLPPRSGRAADRSRGQGNRSRTPYKVVGDPSADSVLTGRIVEEPRVCWCPTSPAMPAKARSP